jgi:pimeloyl-ACP methyl ester carboxylesterase
MNRLLAVDLPGHGLPDPVAFRRGQVRQHARRMIDDLLDAFGLDEVPALLMVDHLGVKQPLGPVERS